MLLPAHSDDVLSDVSSMSSCETYVSLCSEDAIETNESDGSIGSYETYESLSSSDLHKGEVSSCSDDNNVEERSDSDQTDPEWDNESEGLPRSAVPTLSNISKVGSATQYVRQSLCSPLNVSEPSTTPNCQPLQQPQTTQSTSDFFHTPHKHPNRPFNVTTPSTSQSNSTEGDLFGTPGGQILFADLPRRPDDRSLEHDGLNWEDTNLTEPDLPDLCEDTIQVHLSFPDGSRVKKRVSHDAYWVTALSYNQITRDQLRLCPCSRTQRYPNGQFCANQFKYEDYARIRVSRKEMGFTAESNLRRTELSDAHVRYTSSDDHKGAVVMVEEKLLCIQGYIIVCGLPESSIWRLWGRMTKNLTTPRSGRPMLTDAHRNTDEDLTAPQAPHAYAWLKRWGDEVGDHDPAGNELVIDPLEIKEVWIEYEQFCTLTMCRNVRTHYVPYGTFAGTFQTWMKDFNVRMRDKKNFSSKCDGMLLYSHLTDYVFSIMSDYRM